jgi:hypothetical protein
MDPKRVIKKQVHGYPFMTTNDTSKSVPNDAMIAEHD